MAGFGLPNFGQLTEAFRKAQQIQQDAQKLQENWTVWKSKAAMLMAAPASGFPATSSPCGLP